VRGRDGQAAKQAMLTHELKKKAHQEFSGWAETYDDSLLNRFLFEPGHAMLLDALTDLGPGARVLDIGCGTGELARRLARRGCSVVGFDLCEPMLHQIRPKLYGESARVRLAVGVSEHLPFAARTFDAVTCANSFHHYPDQRAVVREMFRVIRPGGRLLVVDGFRDNLIGRIMYDVIITRVEGDVWHRNALDMRDLMRAAGFRKVSQSKRTLALFPILLTCGIVP